jgi:predicted DNA-binding transcriptional regulator AlpA
MDIVGLRRAFIYRLMREGRFPQVVKISDDRAVGWIEVEIQAWLRERIAQTDLRGTHISTAKRNDQVRD